MARKRKTPGMPVVDLRDALTPRQINADLAPAEVADPYEDGAKIILLRSLRDDPLARLHVRRQIDDAQFHAGREYQRLYQIVERAGRAIDYSVPKVDGGKLSDPFVEGRKDAADKLTAAYREMGMLASAVVGAVLGRGLMVAQYAAECGAIGDWAARRYSMRLQDGLEALAILWGYAAKRRNKN